jgi:hypothetical protein
MKEFLINIACFILLFAGYYIVFWFLVGIEPIQMKLFQRCMLFAMVILHFIGKKHERP